jgi:hypothetical protein
MISDNTIVLAATAIADKIDNLKDRKAKCMEWMKSGEQSEENTKFWTHHIELIEKDIQEYTEARQELFKN